MTNLPSGRIQDHARAMRLTADLFRKLCVGALVGLVLFVLAALATQVVTEVFQILGVTDWLRDVAMIILQSWPFALVAGLICGLAAGAWLDAFLRRKETPSDDAEVRDALAQRAEKLAQEISELVIEYREEQTRIFHQEAREEYNGISQRYASVDAKYMSRYSQHYHTQVLTVFMLAKKAIYVDPNYIRDYETALQHPSCLERLPVDLMQLAVDLRHRQPDAGPPLEVQQLHTSIQHQDRKIQELLNEVKRLSSPSPQDEQS